MNVGVLDTISNFATPFFTNPIILYIVILAIVGVDAYASLQGTALVSDANPIKELQSGQYFVISADFYGGSNCSITDGSFFFLESIGFMHKASEDEINSFCRENPCSLNNVSSTNKAISCSFSSTDDTKVSIGMFGEVLTTMLHLIGLPAEVIFSSIQLFLVMLFIPIIIWIATYQLGR